MAEEKATQDQRETRKRLSQDEIEEKVLAFERWMMHMQRGNPQFVMPHTDGPLIDEEGRADLNRVPAAQDNRRRD